MPSTTLRPQTPSPRRRAVAAGLLAVAAGLGVGHGIARFVDPAASPAVAVAAGVVQLAPTGMKEWAVRTLGTADKPVLVAAVVVVSVGLGGLCGALARSTRWAAAVLVALLVAALLEAEHAFGGAHSARMLVGLAALGVGVLTFAGLLRVSGAWGARPDAGTEETGDGSSGRRGASRRVFVLGSLAAGTSAAVGGAIGATPRSVPVTPPTLPTRPSPRAPLPPGLETTTQELSPFVTPVDDFYRIDTALTVPRVPVDGWSLTIDGMVDAPVVVSWDELLALGLVERDVTLACVSNEVGGSYVGSARWLGVRTADVLRAAGLRPGAEQVLSTSVDGFTASTPLGALTDSRDALIAIAMNGAPLAETHGAPARLLTPGLYGYVGATKWLTRLTVTTFAADQAFWTKRGWAECGPMKPSSRIDVPRSNTTAEAGPVVVAGVAWAPRVGVGGVQVRIDGGPWQDARLGPSAGIDYWRQWTLTWTATPGTHEIASRVIDRAGTPQSEQVADPFPDGATGLHTITVVVG